MKLKGFKEWVECITDWEPCRNFIKGVSTCGFYLPISKLLLSFFPSFLAMLHYNPSEVGFSMLYLILIHYQGDVLAH